MREKLSGVQKTRVINVVATLLERKDIAWEFTNKQGGEFGFRDFSHSRKWFVTVYRNYDLSLYQFFTLQKAYTMLVSLDDNDVRVSLTASEREMLYGSWHKLSGVDKSISLVESKLRAIEKIAKQKITVKK